jgi:hypothetical protein
MRHLAVLGLLVSVALGGCQQKTKGDEVREVYDNKADQIDAQAQQQPTQAAKEIYHDRADAFREEGKDREKGLEGGTPSKGHDGGSTAGGATAGGTTPSTGNY